MDQDGREPFHYIEYRALRDEMLIKLTQVGQIYNFFFVSVFATVAWLLVYAESLSRPLALAGAWVPFLVTHYFAAHRKDHSDSIHAIGTYLAALESRFADPDLGWQRTVRVKDGKPVKLYWRTRAIFLYARIATLLFALYYVIAYGRLLDGVDLPAMLGRLPGL